VINWVFTTQERTKERGPKGQRAERVDWVLSGWLDYQRQRKKEKGGRGSEHSVIYSGNCQVIFSCFLCFLGGTTPTNHLKPKKLLQAMILPFGKGQNNLKIKRVRTKTSVKTNGGITRAHQPCCVLAGP